MKKRFFGLILALSMIMSMAIAVQVMANELTEGDYTYSVLDGKAKITKFNSAVSGAISIPPTLGGFTVTNIDNSAFALCDGLTSIIIPSSVTRIGDSAFSNCRGLASIKIPNNISRIGSYAFSNCRSLTSITIPDRIISIGKSAFENTPYYYNSSNWQKNVLYFNGYLLEAKKSLSGEYQIKAGTKCIADDAFSACASITSIIIPDSVKSIGNSAFSVCSSLTSITIPDSVAVIGRAAFSDCNSLTSIKIPKEVTKIDQYTFARCSGLKSIIISNNITHIGFSAFEYSGLTDVFYSGTEEQINKITLDYYNYPFILATKHYNYGKSGLVTEIKLSEPSISAVPKSSHAVNVTVLPDNAFNRSFKCASSNPSVVTVKKVGNSMALSFNDIGTATVTVSATDGSDVSAQCHVSVGNDSSEDKYLLERLALSKVVYNNLTKGITIGEQELSTNKEKVMLTTYNNKKKVIWNNFYSRYIKNYTVLDSLSKSDGMYGAAFQKTNGDIIIAYRGSEGDFTKFFKQKKTEIDWWGTNLPMVLSHQLSSQFSHAVEFYDRVRMAYPNSAITLTGHSLGGALASYVSINRGVRCDNINGATGWIFNNSHFNENYPIQFKGYNFVNENYNESIDDLNFFVTMANRGVFNYTLYSNPTTQTPRTEYHDVASIVEYENNNFALSSVDKNVTVDKKLTIIGSGNEQGIVGSSEDDTIILTAQKIFKKPNSLATSEYNYAPISYDVFAGDGNDYVSLGIGGNDTIIGNSGNDLLNGGSGNDTYVFGGNWGNDTVSDLSGHDKLIFTDRAYSELSIANKTDHIMISCGSNSVKVMKSLRGKNPTMDIVDKEKATIKNLFNSMILFSEQEMSVQQNEISKNKANFVSMFSLNDATKGISVNGSATAEIYDSSNKLIETITVDAQTAESAEYKDYGMISIAPETLSLTFVESEYVVKVMSEGIVSVWTVSDADNCTVAKQTFLQNADLSDGSRVEIDTGAFVGGQLSVKLIDSNNSASDIVTETVSGLDITADTTEIKVGESATLNVTPKFVASVKWECVNNKAIITHNDDYSVTVTGVNGGEEVVRAYLPNDSSYRDEFQLSVMKDAMPAVTVTCGGVSYTGQNIAKGEVCFEVTKSTYYDEIVFNSESEYTYIEDESQYIIDSDGEHSVEIYYRNSENGAVSESFTMQFEQDVNAPEIAGATNEAVYYTDRIITASDVYLYSLNVNDIVYSQEEAAAGICISAEGSYRVAARDEIGNTIELSFEIKALPLPTEITTENMDIVSKIRDDFEEVKYQLPEELRNSLEQQIFNLEETVNSLDIKGRIYDVVYSNGFITATVENRIYENVACLVFVSLYNKDGQLIFLRQPESATLTTPINMDISEYPLATSAKIMLWNREMSPLCETKSIEIQNTAEDPSSEKGHIYDVS